jgi:hypothetical protein
VEVMLQGMSNRDDDNGERESEKDVTFYYTWTEF